MDLPLLADIVIISPMTQKHNKHQFHLRRVSLFGILLIAFFVIRLDAGSLPRPLGAHVLAYASEMSHSALLNGTNNARQANGLESLTLHDKLNAAAQAKAQHMADNDYWAHVAPDGTQPWHFFTQAGYSYEKAGENLAYGFMSSQGAIDGWMNSPSHKANVLGDFMDVGFGIVNTPSYQNSGEQTIVVAHYGTSANTAAAAAPDASSPSSNITPPLTAVPNTKENEITPTNSDRNPDNTSSQSPDDREPAIAAAPVQTGEPSRVSVFSMLSSRSLPIAALLSFTLVSFATAGYVLTHRTAFRHAVTAGEHFVVKHPGIDAALVATITSLILLTTYGNLN